MAPSVARGGVLTAFALLASAAPHPAQTGPKPAPPPKVDPHTRGEAAALERLGYLSFGPFLFGPATSEVVASRLGDVPILWVETAHFRLGSALEEYKPEKPEEIEELRGELEELRALLPRLPARPRKLDPWLRLHLFARRLESLHADLCARLEVQAAPAAGEGPAPEAPAFAFGMKEKFLVLLTHKKSTLARFTREFCGQDSDGLLLHNFPEQGALFYGLSNEHVSATDSDLHYALVHGVVQNLLCGIHGFPRVLPAWWQQGVALWFARAREPRMLLFARPQGETLPPEELADWEPLVRGRVEAGVYLGWEEMLGRPSWLDQPFGDNVVLWSRVDFLLRREGLGPAVARALHLPGHGPPAGAAELERGTGLDLAALDRAWCDWVTASYRKKRR